MTNYERCRYTDQRRVNLDHARAIDYADTTHVSRISSCNVNVDLALALAVAAAVAVARTAACVTMMGGITSEFLFQRFCRLFGLTRVAALVHPVPRRPIPTRLWHCTRSTTYHSSLLLSRRFGFGSAFFTFGLLQRTVLYCPVRYCTVVLN